MWRRIFKVLMLARQVAPLPREFCKDGACFISTNQRGHAFTILRSLKVILNFHTHGARLIRACSQASSTSTTSPISQSGDVTAAAIAGVTLRSDEIVIQIQGCLSHRALAAETKSRLEPAAAACVDLACAARCHGPAATVCRLHGRTAALCGSRSSMAEPAAETAGDPSPEWTCGSASRCREGTLPLRGRRARSRHLLPRPARCGQCDAHRFPARSADRNSRRG